MSQRAVVALAPDLRAAGRVDELAGDANTIPGLAHATLQDVAYAELAPDLLRTSTVRPGVGEMELRAMTKSHRMRDRPVMMSSTMPSAK